jgi:hypothetical protein
MKPEKLILPAVCILLALSVFLNLAYMRKLDNYVRALQLIEQKGGQP